MADHQHVFSYTRTTLTLTQMTLIYKLNLDILKTYLHTETEVLRSRLSKVRPW